MTTPAYVTAKELRARLYSLALMASTFVYGRGLSCKRNELLIELKEVNAALRAEDQIETVTDPETYIRNYLEQGGKWSDIVSAVTRNTNKYGIQYVPQSRKDR